MWYINHFLRIFLLYWATFLSCQKRSSIKQCSQLLTLFVYDYYYFQQAPEAAAAASPATHANSDRPLDLRRHDSVANEDSPSITLYHFNGLRAGNRRATLKQCSLQKRDTGCAIGQNVAFAGGSSAAGSISHVCPVDEVLRTRWPGCRIQWIGTPPSLD
jgi:hypothetical protein